MFIKEVNLTLVTMNLAVRWCVCSKTETRVKFISLMLVV